MSFLSQTKHSTKAISEELHKVFVGASLEVFGDVVKRTPVDTGRLRANWQMDINRMPAGERSDKDKSGAKANKAARGKAMRAKIGDAIYIVNNLPYAMAIEEGHSQSQAPFGMVAITVAEWKQIVRRRT